VAVTAATGQAADAAPEVYRRWLRVDQPKNWDGPPNSLIETLWREKSDEQKKFWRSLDGVREPKPAPGADTDRDRYYEALQRIVDAVAAGDAAAVDKLARNTLGLTRTGRPDPFRPAPELAQADDGTLTAAGRLADMIEMRDKARADRDRLHNALFIIGKMIPPVGGASADECRKISEVVWALVHDRDGQPHPAPGLSALAGELGSLAGEHARMAAEYDRDDAQASFHRGCRAALFNAAGRISYLIASREPQPAPDPDNQQRYIDQLHDLIRDTLAAYPSLATELPTFQDRAGALYVYDHDGQPISGSWADRDGPRPQPAPASASQVRRLEAQAAPGLAAAMRESRLYHEALQRAQEVLDGDGTIGSRLSLARSIIKAALEDK
jgi:hypothetical protein